ncbi:MAG TPA: ammonium transporter [Polyangiales bacterium]|nr:ammonium transporter [Polyangiales bacterium]
MPGLEDTQTALNIVWTMMAAFLVMFMQAGFALVESGLTRGKNVANTMAMNFLVYSIAMLGYWAVGFGLQMGGVGPLATLGGDSSLSREFTVTVLERQHGLFGGAGFFLSPQVFTPGVAAMFFFQAVFCATGTTIPTGALAERWKFASFVLFSFVVSMVIYPGFANWVWGGGWLSSLGRNFGFGHGHVDFAGSSVVHLTGGVLALVGAQAVGPRLGKFGPNGLVRAIPGHSAPLVVLGTFVLAFGWFGFNAGSTLSGMDGRLAIVAVNTVLSCAAGAFAACLYTWARFGKPDLSMMCNGLLAGAVAITAPCAFVSTFSAVVIGAIGGVLVVASTLYVEHELRVDDPVGAISVHGVNGAWGVLALGLFADGTYGDGINGVYGPVRGLFYGDAGQLVAELIGISSNILFVGCTGWVTLKVIDKLVGNRVSYADEQRGLDVSELGLEGYPPQDELVLPLTPRPRRDSIETDLMGLRFPAE